MHLNNFLVEEKYPFIMPSDNHDDVIKWKPFPALLAIRAGNSPVTGEFHAQRLVTRSVDASCDLHMNERLSKQPWGWWFETPSRPLWRHSNGCWQPDDARGQYISNNGIGPVLLEYYGSNTRRGGSDNLL